MDSENIKHLLMEIAHKCIDDGPRSAQEPVVLQEAARRLNGQADLSTQQLVLTAWHDLFREGTLAWGFDLTTPGAPFFHIAKR